MSTLGAWILGMFVIIALALGGTALGLVLSGMCDGKGKDTFKPSAPTLTPTMAKRMGMQHPHIGILGMDNCWDNCENASNGMALHEMACKNSCYEQARHGEAVRAASYPAVWMDLAQQSRHASWGDRKNERELACAAACMGSPNVPVSAHCARTCAAAVGRDFS